MSAELEREIDETLLGEKLIARWEEAIWMDDLLPEAERREFITLARDINNIVLTTLIRVQRVTDPSRRRAAR